MRIQLDCIHCTLRQVLEAARYASSDPAVHKEIILKSLDLLANYDFSETPPTLGRAINRLVSEYTNNEDPYREIKAQSIQMALEVYPELQKFVKEQDDPLRAAVHISAIGNLIDAGAYADLHLFDLRSRLKGELKKEFALLDLEELRRDLKTARTILILGDNAGETVLDRILINEIKNSGENKPQIYYGVRSAPVINDATWEDAVASGLDQETTIVETGSTTAGFIEAEADSEFLKLYSQADLVISKGQGNYETLSESDQRTIYFILIAKCRAAADDIGVGLGDYVLLKKSN
ncbi:MAG: DUF89 family protein [Firmicutes bacterium]|nr:DUF89 family protein [Bacillota bacterium]